MPRQSIDQPAWWANYEDHLPRSFIEHISIEDNATEMRVFNPLLIPGLLQTEAYARHVIEHLGANLRSKNLQKQLLALRMERQKHVFERLGHINIAVLLDQSISERQLGGTQILIDQLQHLTELAKLPNIHLRILPYSIGFVWSAIGVTAYTIFYTPEKNFVSSERTFMVQDISSNQFEVAYHSTLFADLCEQALDEKATVVLLEQCITNLQAQISRSYDLHD